MEIASFASRPPLDVNILLPEKLVKIDLMASATDGSRPFDDQE